MAQEVIKHNDRATLSLTTISQIGADELCVATKCRSVKAAVEAGTPMLGEVVHAGGEGQMLAFIEGNIIALAVFCNLPKGSITPSQIQTTADMILAEFGNLTIADVNLVFRRAKMGEYGPFYGRLDGQMILSWFGQYLDERCEYFAERSQAESGDDFRLPNISEAARAHQELNKLMRIKK